ncbi:hypothetical protein TRIUR3_10545 [Triticum urartu]|uniref:Uncharacterized protein n=1 Tax=Triticum urartu TaxID=4572 RepID=M8A5C1_TRIUA|nr:hypothetical protein TRIUR3_10545 [Triticum urartu]
MVTVARYWNVTIIVSYMDKTSFWVPQVIRELKLLDGVDLAEVITILVPNRSVGLRIPCLAALSWKDTS